MARVTTSTSFFDGDFEGPATGGSSFALPLVSSFLPLVSAVFAPPLVVSLPLGELFFSVSASLPDSLAAAASLIFTGSAISPFAAVVSEDSDMILVGLDCLPDLKLVE